MLGFLNDALANYMNVPTCSKYDVAFILTFSFPSLALNFP